MSVRLRTVLAVPLTVVVASAVLSTADASTAPPPAARGAGEGAAVRAAPVPPALLPDARALKASHLVITQNGQHRVLRFESGLANVGRGPLEVRPNRNRHCPRGQQHASQIIYRDQDHSGHFSRKHDKRITRRSAGCMIFHPRHDHWHFEAAARYVLFDPDRQDPIVVVGRKMSFCLRDTRRAPERWPTPNYPEFYGACSKHAPQGISIGWVDIYQNFLPGQAIRLPDALANGVYCLRTTVDPRDNLRETDDENNASLRAFRLQGRQVTIRPDAPCRTT